MERGRRERGKGETGQREGARWQRAGWKTEEERGEERRNGEEKEGEEVGWLEKVEYSTSQGANTRLEGKVILKMEEAWMIIKFSQKLKIERKWNE